MRTLKIKFNDLIFFILLLAFIIFTIIPNTVIGIGFLLILIFYVAKNLKNKLEIITLLTMVFMLQMVLRIYTSGILLTICTYLDEFFAVIGCIYIFLYIFKNKKTFFKYEKKVICAMIFLILIGILSNYIYGYQKIIPIIVDILTYCKFIIYYLTARIYAKKNFPNDIFGEYFNTKIRMIAMCLFILAILNIAIPSLYNVYDYRYFTNSIQLFFPHPTYLAAFSILCIIILLHNNKKKGNFMYILMLSVVTILTFRTKAIVALMAIIFIYVVSCKLKIRSNFFIIMFVMIVGIYMAYDQIQFYYLNDNIYTIRREMTLDGIGLANEKFPIGTGFATFGSSAAYQFESPLYYKLGYFSSDIEAFGDIFWPIIIAQNGWLGFLIFLYIIYCFLKTILKNIKKDTIFFVCAISIFVYEIIASMAETAFFSPIAPAYFIILGFIVDIHEKKIKENQMESEQIEK